jgi:hypothetical protein
MQYPTQSCGYKLSFTGQDTVEEYDEAAGEPGAALKDAVNNTIYRSTLPEWQNAFGKLLQERTKIPREIDPDATARVKARAKNPNDTKAVPERFRTYNTRVRKLYAGADGENGGDPAKVKELETWAQEVAASITVDPSPARVSAIAKGDLLKAEDILDHDTDYIEAKVQKFLAAVPEFELIRDDDNRPEKQSLARLVGRYIDVVL